MELLNNYVNRVVKMADEVAPKRRNSRKKSVVEVQTEAPTEAVVGRKKATKKEQAIVPEDRYHLRANQVKVLIAQRQVRTACIVNNDYDQNDDAPYMIQFELIAGETITLLHSSDDKIRSFASLDKAVKMIQDLGIKGDITVCVSANYD
jgi:hypothetical protein